MSKKVILVTGGLGFIGSNFIDLCLERGNKVINIDKLTYASNPSLNEYYKKNYGEDYQFIQEDIKDLTALPFCDYLVNFAAESHVDNSINDSRPFIDSNYLGVYNLLKLIVQAKRDNLKFSWNYQAPRFIQISTDEVFGDIEEGFFKEGDRLNPSNPYSATKASAELLIKAWARTYSLDYVLTRTTNNYGPRQHAEKLIPHTITSVLNGKKINIHGTGDYVRNWVHVKDNCEAIYLVMLNGETNNEYHISSDEEFSVTQIVKAILNYKKLPFDDSTVNFVPNRAGQDVRYALDCSKIKALGWKQQRTLEKSLSELFNYYEENVKNGPNSTV